MNQQLDNTLIENALALTGKTMDDMEEIYKSYDKVACIVDYENMDLHFDYSTRFSIKNFCYYLLSPEFIEKYSEIYNYVEGENFEERTIAFTFWLAIYEYQNGDSQPLITLLQKIWKN